MDLIQVGNFSSIGGEYIISIVIKIKSAKEFYYDL
jgi:hypothetical protein